MWRARSLLDGFAHLGRHPRQAWHAPLVSSVSVESQSECVQKTRQRERRVAPRVSTRYQMSAHNAATIVQPRVSRVSDRLTTSASRATAAPMAFCGRSAHRVDAVLVSSCRLLAHTPLLAEDVVTRA